MLSTSFLRAAFQPVGFTRFASSTRSSWTANAKQAFRSSTSRASYQTSVVGRLGARHSYSTSRKWAFPLVGLGVMAAIPATMGSSAFMKQPVLCEAPRVSPQPRDLPPPPEPESIVNIYELSFGAVCGICAGVFIKKGAKMLAFFLGGIFVLLQYFNSLSLISVNWNQASARFDNLFSTTGADGVRHPPTVWSLWSWLVNFLLADFQQRASFLAGLVLGLRVG